MKASLLLAAGGLSIVAGAAMAQSGRGTGDPAENWARVAACADYALADERHACIDNVLRAAGLIDVQREIEEQRRTFGQQEQPATRAAPPPPPAAAPVSTPAPVSPAAPPKEIDRLVTTVAGSRIAGRDKLLVMTDEGAIWRQTSSEKIRREPDLGSPFEVEETSLGGYRCKIASGVTYRCERAD